MAAGRSSKSLVSRRRRVGEDDEEDGPDSQSEGSVLSGNDDDGDASTVEGGKTTDIGNSYAATSIIEHRSGRQKSSKRPQTSTAVQPTTFITTADTEVMMQGLVIKDGTQDAVDYANDTPQADTTRQMPARTKKEHEEYKKQRDADPAFIPNRGNFFMHDTRSQHMRGQLPFRGSATEVSFRVDRPSEKLWKHDLHDAINEGQRFDQGGKSSARLFTRPTNTAPTASAEPISFSSTKLLGRVQVRVFLPSMSKAITYAEVPLKKYVKLPDHRPPLRRDKPLRIYLPNIGPRYIFPATERSFIFIPRQMRPNQRGNSNQRNTVGYGPSSRRTSMYGGSVYSGSIAASRRSSIARDREGMFSPGSYAGGFQPPNRPVVRLPRSGHFYGTSTPPMGPFPGQHTPIHQVHTYPLPQQPAFQGTPTTTVQHPRPQKTISVSGIESPAALTQRQTPADQQPFHSQLPLHLADHAAPYYPPSQQYAYAAPLAQIASPLSQIPEQAAHGPGYQQMYPYAQQQSYYYGPPQMPMYMVPPPQQGFMYPPQVHSQLFRQAICLMSKLPACLHMKAMAWCSICQQQKQLRSQHLQSSISLQKDSYQLRGPWSTSNSCA